MPEKTVASAEGSFHILPAARTAYSKLQYLEPAEQCCILIREVIYLVFFFNFMYNLDCIWNFKSL